MIRYKGDISELPRVSEEVRIQLFLTRPVVEMLLDRCPELSQVILTRTAERYMTSRAKDLLEEREIVITREKRGGGRPIEHSRVVIEEIEEMGENTDLSYRQISERTGVPCSTVARIVRGEVKKERWREDYG